MPEAFNRIDSYYAGAYWGPRKETPKECARRAEAFLAALAKIDPAFSRWFELGRSRKEALKRPIEPSGEALEGPATEPLAAFGVRVEGEDVAEA